MNSGPIGTQSRPQVRGRSGWRRRPAAKIKRVAKVVVDQTVFCPECGGPMHLSPNHIFSCGHCGHQIAAEDAIETIAPI